MSASKYLGICLGFTLSLLVLIASLNFVADPFGIYHGRWGWIRNRAGIAHFLCVHKTYSVQAFKPDALILGNSRVLHAIDPQYPALPVRTYNLGIPAANVYVCWRYLQHVSSSHLPHLVILAIDERMFDAYSTPSMEFSETRLRVAPDGQVNPFSRFSDLGPSLLSCTALFYSMETLATSSGPDFSFLQGFQANEMLEVKSLNLTRNVYAANETFLTPYTSDFRDQNGKEPQMDAFAQIISFCAQNHIRLIVFIHPLHASLTDLNTEDWNKYCIWMKATVLKIDSSLNSQSEMWDFTGYNNMTTESFPPHSDKESHMLYFWEGAHYRINVGNMVLSRILTSSGPDNFGFRVNSSNVQEDLDRIKEEKEAWHLRGQFVRINEASASTPIKPIPVPTSP